MLDSSVLPLEFGLNLMWNAAKYARKIKCNLGNSVTTDEGVCSVLLKTHSKEWKTFLHKASYFEQTSLRKISFEMNVPVTVKVYYHDIGFINPQLVSYFSENSLTNVPLGKNFSVTDHLVDFKIDRPRNAAIRKVNFVNTRFL